MWSWDISRGRISNLITDRIWGILLRSPRGRASLLFLLHILSSCMCFHSSASCSPHVLPLHTSWHPHGRLCCSLMDISQQVHSMYLNPRLSSQYLQFCQLHLRDSILHLLLQLAWIPSVSYSNLTSSTCTHCQDFIIVIAHLTLLIVLRLFCVSSIPTLPMFSLVVLVTHSADSWQHGRCLYRGCNEVGGSGQCQCLRDSAVQQSDNDEGWSHLSIGGLRPMRRKDDPLGTTMKG